MSDQPAVAVEHVDGDRGRWAVAQHDAGAGVVRGTGGRLAGSHGRRPDGAGLDVAGRAGHSLFDFLVGAAS